MKTLLVICDGIGDRPIKEFRGKTPLEEAKTPNLDKLAERGINGLMNSIIFPVRPGSDVSHLSIFGYNINEYYSGRGPFEALGIGLDLKKGDVALRANLGTVENGTIKDRRAGRIESKLFEKELQGIKIEGIEFIVKAGTGHRVAIVMRGKKLSPNISDSDPHETEKNVLKVKALDESEEAEFTARILNQFLEKTHKILEKHSENKKRKLKANYLLTRGAGEFLEIPSMQEKYGLKSVCVAGAGLYKGISKAIGMKIVDVKEATGKLDTNIDAKFDSAIKALKENDFVFVHIKGTDLCGENGDAKAKKEFIEKIDKAAEVLTGLKNTLIVVTADHSTPCELKAHSGDPVPIVFCGPGVRTDSVKEFGERSCAKGGLHRIIGMQIMPEIMNLSGKAELLGA